MCIIFSAGYTVLFSRFYIKCMYQTYTELKIPRSVIKYTVIAYNLHMTPDNKKKYLKIFIERKMKYCTYFMHTEMTIHFYRFICSVQCTHQQIHFSLLKLCKITRVLSLIQCNECIISLVSGICSRQTNIIGKHRT